jgi:hypothetical protein
MYRASTRQAALDARTAQRRRVQSLLMGAPDPYTSIGERPGRALLAGVGVGVLIAVVLSVITMAGVARQAAKEKEQAAAATRAAAAPPAATARPGTPPVTGAAPAAEGVTRDDSGAVTGGTGGSADGEPVVVAVVVRDGAAACQREATEMDVEPRFTGGLLRSIQVSGFGPGCAGRTGSIRVLGPGDEELAARSFEAVQGLGERVSGWDGLRRDQIDRIVVAV